MLREIRRACFNAKPPLPRKLKPGQHHVDPNSNTQIKKRAHRDPNTILFKGKCYRWIDEQEAKFWIRIKARIKQGTIDPDTVRDHLQSAIDAYILVLDTNAQHVVKTKASIDDLAKEMNRSSEAVERAEKAAKLSSKPPSGPPEYGKTPFSRPKPPEKNIFKRKGGHSYADHVDGWSQREGSGKPIDKWEV